MRKHIAIMVSVLVFALSAAAQIAEKKSLNLEGARKAIAAAEAYAKKVNAPGGVIAVVDDGGNLIALERLDGTFAAGANISIGKARTAALFKRPTKFFEDVIKNGRTAMVAVSDFTPLQGGVPIVVGGEVIGAVGVSGAASAAQDEELANAAADAFKTAPQASSAPVMYFPKSDVDDAFRKGAVLLNGDGRNYMVHASRRDQAGMAEIHGKDADVIHVLDGKATFVTGGSMVDPKTTAADEVRGPTIEGGETRELAKGDVVIVPAGVPHWFKQVNGPFLYYVVKVR